MQEIIITPRGNDMETPLEVFMKRTEIEERVKEILARVTKMSLKDILSYAIKGERCDRIFTPFSTRMFREHTKKKTLNDSLRWKDPIT